MNPYGQMVEEARHANGLTMRELGAACDVTASFVNDIEKGRRAPSDELHEGLMRALGVGNREDFDVALAIARGYVTATDCGEKQIRAAIRALRGQR